MTRITGLTQLRAKLKAMPAEVRKEIHAAMEAGAEEMVQMAKRLCPVASGDLRDSIGWTWDEAPAGAMVLAQSTAGDERITIFAGNSKAFYARWVEFGSVKTSAWPFFYPSYRALKKWIKARTSRAVGKAMKTVAAGGN